MHFKQCLEEVMEYYDRPLPAIIGQSVHVVTWIYMVVSAFAAQPWCDHEFSFWYFLQVYLYDHYSIILRTFLANLIFSNLVNNENYFFSTPRGFHSQIVS